MCARSASFSEATSSSSCPPDSDRAACQSRTGRAMATTAGAAAAPCGARSEAEAKRCRGGRRRSDGAGGGSEAKGGMSGRRMRRALWEQLPPLLLLLLALTLLRPCSVLAQDYVRPRLLSVRANDTAYAKRIECICRRHTVYFLCSSEPPASESRMFNLPLRFLLPQPYEYPPFEPLPPAPSPPLDPPSPSPPPPDPPSPPV